MDTIRFFICGSAMQGQPDHYVLTGARFIGEARTAADYRMHSVDQRHPAVYRVSTNGVQLKGELYELSPTLYEALLAQEPPGLYEDDVVLEDGSIASAMCFPRELVEQRGYLDISEYGSWTAYKDAIQNP